MERFREYLRHKCVYVDVWDGASLLQIGTARVPLAALLRKATELGVGVGVGFGYGLGLGLGFG